MAATTRPAIAVVGAGRGGLAMAHIVARAGHSVLLFTTLAERAARLNQQRALPEILPELDRLHDGVQIVTDAMTLASQCELVLLTTSSEYAEPVLRVLGDALDGAHQVVHAVHKLDTAALRRTSQAIMALTCVRQTGVMAGPTHVSELLSGLPNAMVVGSAYPRIIARVRSVLGSDSLQVVGNPDLIGVELAASLVQVVAMAVGVSDALGLGDANHAVILTRGLAEMTRVGTITGAQAGTFAGLAGVGRLVDTIRRGEPNYRLGRELVSGAPTRDVIAAAPPEAQGVQVLRALRDWATLGGHQLDLVQTLMALVDGTGDGRSLLEQYLRSHGDDA